MTRLAAIAILCASCTPTPWLVRYNCTKPPEQIYKLPLVECEGLATPWARCLYSKGEPCDTVGGNVDITCYVEAQRHECKALWVVVGDSCLTAPDPPDGAEYLLPEEFWP